MKRTGLIVVTLAMVLVLIVACCPARKAPPQPPIAPPPQAEVIPPPETVPTPPIPPIPTAPGHMLQTVYFDFDKFDIRPMDVKAMGENEAWLRDNPDSRLTLEGYCDPVGTEEYNRGLGLRRSNAAKAYLVKQGIDAARLTAISFGEEKPVTTDPKQFGLNRRVEFVAK
jgi:peptidoglycan-associated lipoprotein